MRECQIPIVEFTVRDNNLMHWIKYVFYLEKVMSKCIKAIQDVKMYNENKSIKLNKFGTTKI